MSRHCSQPGMTALGGFANLPGEVLARLSGVSLSTARRWRRKQRAPAAVVALLEVLYSGMLGLISPAWRGWTLRDGKLGNTDGHEYSPGEVWAIPILHQQVAVLEATIRRLQKQIAQQTALLRNESAANQASITLGQAQALSRAARLIVSSLPEIAGDALIPVADRDS